MVRVDEQPHQRWSFPQPQGNAARATMHERIIEDVSRVLTQSLELDAMLQAVSGIVVPSVADLCAIYICEPDDTLRLVTLTHTDAGRAAVFEAFHGLVASNRLSQSLLQRSVQFDQPQIVMAMPHESGHDDAELMIMRAVGFTSYALIPVRGRQRLEGIISLAMLFDDQRFDSSHLPLLADLGLMLTPALERARLYHAMQREMEARQQAESALHSFYNSVPFRLGVIELRDTDAIVIVANNALVRLLGCHRDDLVGQSLREVAHALNIRLETAEHWLRRCDDVWRSRHAARLDVEWAGRTLAVTIAPLEDPSTTRPRCSFIVEDISDERRMTAALAESEQRFRAVLRDSPIVVFTHTPDLRYSWIYNPVGQLTSEEIVGRTDADLIDLEEARHLMDFKRQVLHSGVADRCEITLTIDDRAHTYDLRAEPIVELDGSISGLLCVSIDITESKQVQADLRFSETRYRMLLENLPDTAVVLLDSDGRIVLLEGSLLEALGVDVAAHRTQHVTNLITAEQFPEVFRLIHSAMHGQSGETTFLFGRRTLLLEVLPIVRSIIQEREVMLVLRDLTEQVNAEADRLKLERRLLETQRSESIGVLASGVAHDFNNILTGILSHAELISAESSIDPVTLRSVEAIMTGAQRAADLTRQILAYTGKAMLQMQPLDINRLITEMVDLLRVSISKNCTLVYQLSEKLPMVEGDAAQIRQVIMNLLINASEAIGHESGQIVVTSSVDSLTRQMLDTLVLGADRTSGQYVRLTVGDTGSGMDMTTQARMFEPYFTTKFTGRGLGLAAVHGIIRGHRGALRVTSTPGNGTSFSIWLPVTATVPAPRPLIVPPRAQGRGRVLIIDDEPGICDVAARLLSREGFTVTTASDPEHGLGLARAAIEELSVVLLDLTMPRMNGVAVARSIRETRNDLPIVLMSGYSADEIAQIYADVRFDGVVQKPFTRDVLRAAIDAALARS